MSKSKSQTLPEFDAQISLLNKSVFPPGGWKYFEPSLAWRNPDPLNGEGLDFAVRLLQIVRSRNPLSDLDPTYSACLKAIVDFTCKRLKNDPRWCGLPPLVAQEEGARAHAKTGRRCASCGRR
jgi:hypothetical protein